MFLKKIVPCFVLLFVWDLITETVALKEDAEGVCVGKISSKKTKRVFYTKYNNKWCGKKKCVVRVSKSQPYQVNSNIVMCCKGWQYISAEDKCTPLCSTGCQNGRCIAPEKCQCDPPSFLDPDHPNICVTPVCEPACYNAECISNSTCECLPNFTNHNSSHCHNCSAGYTVDRNFNCIPFCEKPCENGVCSGPNICTCDTGFILEGSRCVPKCEACVNSSCVAPNTCACLDGYKPINETHCEPICSDCGRGVCDSPGVCVCDNGYTDVNGTCKPVCEGSCVNGECLSPNVCSCNVGYEKNSTNPGVCYKPCAGACPGDCNLHGECSCQQKLT